MRQPHLLYLETSIFGFYFDDSPHNRQRRESVRTLFQQIELGIVNAVASSLTAEELGGAAEPNRGKFLNLLSLVERLDADDVAVGRLTQLYLADGIFPLDFATDARHAACATLSGAEILVTLNLKHLANERAERRLNAVNLREGYPMLRIKTPEEVLHYED